MSIITIAGENLITQKAQANQQLDIDTFVFAYVPGQDHEDPIDRNETLPTLAQQVHSQAVQQTGMINENTVVYSTVLESVTGNFEFNWVGLYSSVNDTLITIEHIPTVIKTKSALGKAGNTLNRNFGIKYSGISDLTGITVAAETWQLDFTARLAGMDELTRNFAKDLNGQDSFIDDGFKVIEGSSTNDFDITTGIGYVNGLRVELETTETVTATSYPKNIYVDAYFDGDASSTWTPKKTITITGDELTDYTDVNGKEHYLVKIAIVTDADEIEDLRVSFTEDKDTTTKNFKTVAEYKKYPKEFFVGKIIYLMQTKLKYTVTNGVILGNDETFIDSDTVSQHLEVLNDSEIGVKITRSNNRRHFGWGSTAVLSNGTWMQIFRSSESHATVNGSKIMVHFSDNQGSIWYGERLIYQQATSDARPDALWVMANGRVGFILNRASESGGIHYSPLFMYTDDNGATWSNVEITMPSPYTFSAVGGLIDYPTSQGGSDATGFITFGTASAGQLDALTTVDNGNTWTIVHEVNTAPVVVDSISETCICRLGEEDKWLVYARARAIGGGWSEQSVVFKITDLFNWGLPLFSGVQNRGTPPAVAYNNTTGNVDLYIVARGGKDIYYYNNALLVSSEDSDILWGNNGVYSGYTERIVELPNWFTGYLHPFMYKEKTYFTFMCGENPNSINGSTSSVAVLSDVATSSKDTSTLASVGLHHIEGKSIELVAESNVTTEKVISIRNSGLSANSSWSAYEDRHNMGGADYLSYFSDNYKQDVRGDFTIKVSRIFSIETDNILLGNSAHTGGLSATVHIPVIQSGSPAVISKANGTSSSRTHYQFINDTGIGGSISLSGATTSFNTSSDPRLKTEFTEVGFDEAMSVITKLNECVGKFQFKSVPDKDVVGFDAHKVLDIDGLGSEIGTEGDGSRDKNVGDVYCHNPDIVKKMDDGSIKIVEKARDIKVSPASVDQSKAVPYLLIVVEHLVKKITAIENNKIN